MGEKNGRVFYYKNGKLLSFVPKEKVTTLRDALVEHYSNKFKCAKQSGISKRIKEADEKATNMLSKLFPGYKPIQLSEGKESEYVVNFIKNPDGSYRVERKIVNAATLPNGNVDIGNPELANSIHERIHEIMSLIAMKRAGIANEDHISAIQIYRFHEEREKLISNMFVHCFPEDRYPNITSKEIYSIIGKDVSPEAMTKGELGPEGMVRYYDQEQRTELSDRVYNYLVKEWKK